MYCDLPDYRKRPLKEKCWPGWYLTQLSRLVRIHQISSLEGFEGSIRVAYSVAELDTGKLLSDGTLMLNDYSDLYDVFRYIDPNDPIQWHVCDLAGSYAQKLDAGYINGDQAMVKKMSEQITRSFL